MSGTLPLGEPQKGPDQFNPPALKDNPAWSAGPPKLTEREVLDLLRKRHVALGNGGAGEWAYAEHVRNGAAFDANRTFDAVAMNLWPSRGLTIHVYEVKCSRSDLLRELRDPAKAEDAARVADFFTLVLSSPSLIKPGELPDGWGLMAVTGQTKLRLQLQVEARPLRDLSEGKTRPVDRGFVVGLLRASGAVPQAEAPEVHAARLEGAERQREADERMLATVREEHARAWKRVQAFEAAAGIKLWDPAWNEPEGHLEDLGHRVRAILSGETEAKRSRDRIRSIQSALRMAADDLEKHLGG